MMVKRQSKGIKRGQRRKSDKDMMCVPAVIIPKPKELGIRIRNDPKKNLQRAPPDSNMLVAIPAHTTTSGPIDVYAPAQVNNDGISMYGMNNNSALEYRKPPDPPTSTRNGGDDEMPLVMLSNQCDMEEMVEETPEMLRG